MASTGANPPQPQPQRPFACPECTNCYTRQEHLDRHIGAKHRGSKEFICSVCNKGFGRRDILKRHETAHNKPDGKLKAPSKAVSVSTSAFTKQNQNQQHQQSTSRSDSVRVEGKKREQPSQISDLPAKIIRIARACNRCSKSKLRCDGEEPCSRCRSSGLECTFDRATGWSQPPPSLPVSRAPSVVSSDDNSNSPLTGDSGEEDRSRSRNNKNNNIDRRIGNWNHQSTTNTSSTHHDSVWSHPTPLPPGSPYALPPRLSAYQQPHIPHHQHPHHQAAFPPSSFQHGGLMASQFSPVRGGGGPFDPFTNTPYSNTRPSHLLPHQDPSFPSLDYSTTSPPIILPAPSTTSSDAAAGHHMPPWHWEALGRPSNPSLSSADFLDLIASNETEIDWDLLHNGWTENGNPEPLNASLLVSGALPPPHNNSNSNNNNSHHPELHLDSTRLTDSNLLDILRPRSSSDLAAVSLLQLKSHTPRESPEIELDPRINLNQLRDSWGGGSVQFQSRSSPRPPQSNSQTTTTNFTDDENMVPNIVPRLTDESWNRLEKDIENLNFAGGLSSYNGRTGLLPELESLDVFIQLFFHRFQTLIPILHAPTFDANTCPSYLVLSVAAIGSRYAYDFNKGSAIFANTLSDLSVRLLQHTGEIDPSVLRTLAFCQAQVLDLQAGLISGNKRDLERSHSFSGISVASCKRQGWLLDKDVDDEFEAGFSLDERWRRWKDREEIKRLGFSTIILDGMGTVMWDLESTTLWVEAARTTLPCADSLWEAPTAPAWQSLFPGGTLPTSTLQMSEVINGFSDRSLHSSPNLLLAAKDIFSMAVVATVIHCIITLTNREMRATALFLPIAVDRHPKANPVQIAIDTCLDFCFDHVLLPAECHADLETSSVAQNSMAVMLHLTSMSALLPVRILQALALAGASTPPPDVIAGVNTWARRDGGHAARRTVWHAGQLLALCRLTETDTPLEPFALFYSALVLLAFVDHSDRHHGATLHNTPPTGTGEDYGLRLDKLVDRNDPGLSQWLVTGEGSVSLTGIGELESDVDSEVVREKLLRVIGAKLINLQAWKVGELLGRTLCQLADEGGRRWKGGVKVKMEDQ